MLIQLSTSVRVPWYDYSRPDDTEEDNGIS